MKINKHYVLELVFQIPLALQLRDYYSVIVIFLARTNINRGEPKDGKE